MTAQRSDLPAFEVVLDLDKVKFPRRSESYHVRLELTQKALPMHLWFQDNTSKFQCILSVPDRKCIANEVVDGKSKDGVYSLPAKVVLTALKLAQATLNDMHKNASSQCTIEHYRLDLQSVDDGYLKLVLTLTLFERLEVVYSFDLKPVSVEKIDILEAKVEDLEILNQSPNKLNGFYAVSASATDGKAFVTWSLKHCCSDTNIFDFNDDFKQVKLFKKGLYQIQVTGRREWSASHYLSVFAHGKHVTLSSGQELSVWKAMSFMATVCEKPLTLSVYCQGAGHPLEEGVSLTVIYLGQFA
ncbi:hypothetical protein AC1031_007904 [Aphanomyces cochlioides]|nr:hypothetical protein AC1031_007904 [Aphanomyces cochlioides]